MDVMDAGAWVAHYSASVPKTAQMHLWGPLQAKELGLQGWEVQDGGETGFILHNFRSASMGRLHASLIFVRRKETAHLVLTLAGYPADAPVVQRALEFKAAVGDCQVFLSRLAKQPVNFELQGEMTVVDYAAEGAKPSKSSSKKATGGAVTKESEPEKVLGGGRLNPPGREYVRPARNEEHEA